MSQIVRSSKSNLGNFSAEFRQLLKLSLIIVYCVSTQGLVFPLHNSFFFPLNDNDVIAKKGENFSAEFGQLLKLSLLSLFTTFQHGLRFPLRNS